MFAKQRTRSRRFCDAPIRRRLEIEELERREYPNFLVFDLANALTPALPSQFDASRALGVQLNWTLGPRGLRSQTCDGPSNLPSAERDSPLLDELATSNPNGLPFTSATHSRMPTTAAAEQNVSLAPLTSSGRASAATGEQEDHHSSAAASDDHTHAPMLQELLSDSGPVGSGDAGEPSGSHHVSFRNAPTGFHDMLSNMFSYRIEETYGQLTMPQVLVLGIERALATWRSFGAPFEVQEAQSGSAADFVLRPSNACDPGADACTASTAGPRTGYLIDQHHWHRWLSGTVEVRFVQQGMIWVDDPNDKPNGHPEETQQNDFDAETVALHELGHVLGLDHDPAGSGTIMEPVYQGARRVPSEFHRYDVFHLYHDAACPALPCW